MQGIMQLPIFQFPELIIAALVGIVMIANRRAGEDAGAASPPAWLLDPAVSLLESAPQRYRQWLANRLTWASWRGASASGTLAAIKIYGALLSMVAAVVVPFWAALLAALVIFFLPDAVVAVAATRRKQRIKEALPQALDLMVLCVDAGLGLDSTLQKISSEKTAIRPELNEELLILSRDVLLGMDRERAYQELYRRSGVEELRALGASLNQAAKLGISVSKILRAQSDFLRSKLSQKAEEKASRLPIYMAFPLWFFIMPALMVILLAPSFIIFFDFVKPMIGR